MNKHLLTTIFFCLIVSTLAAQSLSKTPLAQRSWFPKSLPEGYSTGFYFYWGYNRASYSLSDVHFHGPTYDFTVYDIVARDRPTKFTVDDYFSPTKIMIPQYNYRLGYHLNRHWAISVGLDHMKYVMDRYQRVRMSGVVTEAASATYAGTYLNQEVVLVPEILTFEHTDGLNLITLDVEHKTPVYRHHSQRFGVEWLLGAGGVWLLPRTDVRVFGKGLNNNFHIAGYSLTGKTGLKFYFFKRLFLLAETKVGYASLPSILIENAAPERADQTFLFWEKMGAIGFNFHFKSKQKRAQKGL